MNITFPQRTVPHCTWLGDDFILFFWSPVTSVVVPVTNVAVRDRKY